MRKRRHAELKQLALCYMRMNERAPSQAGSQGPYQMLGGRCGSVTARVPPAGSLTLCFAGEARVNPALLISPGQRLPGRCMREPLEVDKTKRPPQPPVPPKNTGVDPDSSPGPQLAPVRADPGCRGALHSFSVYAGQGAYLPPQWLQPFCLPCKQPAAPHHHLEARGQLPGALGGPGLF